MRYVLVLIALSLLPVLPLAQPGLPVTHDGPDHVARIANFYQSLAEGNIVPRWAANLNWGYGHPVLMFLYPLPSYVASFFHATGFSFVDSTKLVFVVFYVGSVLAMYFFLRELFSDVPAYVGAVMYGFAPYRFVDMSVRGAIGEHVAFAFPPLILYGLLRISRKGDALGFVVTAFSTAFLLLSHNAVSIMFLPVIIGFAVYLFLFETKGKRDFFLIAASSLILGFGLASFFLAPAFFEGKYTLRDIVTGGEFSSRFVPWQRLLYSPWSYGGSAELSHALGYVQWAAVILVIVSFKRFKRRAHRILAVSVLVGLSVTLFLITRASEPIWDYVTILQKFQFPWRFLSLAVFLAAVCGTLAAVASGRYARFFAVVTTVIVLATTYGMWPPKGQSLRPDSAYEGAYPGTTDTGESSPIWSVRFMEHFPSAPLAFIEGNGAIEELRRTTTDHEYSVTAATESRLVENTLYFPDWEVFVDGVRSEVEYQDPSFRGLMTFRVSSGEHAISVVFRDTKLRRFAYIMSVFALGLVVFESTILWRRIRV